MNCAKFCPGLLWLTSNEVQARTDTASVAAVFAQHGVAGLAGPREHTHTLFDFKALFWGNKMGLFHFLSEY